MIRIAGGFTRRPITLRSFVNSTTAQNTAAQGQGKRRRRRLRMSEQVPVNVGEDITAPSEIASGGRIRIRSSNAATVARSFGLRCRAVLTDMSHLSRINAGLRSFFGGG